MLQIESASYSDMGVNVARCFPGCMKTVLSDVLEINIGNLLCETVAAQSSMDRCVSVWAKSELTTPVRPLGTSVHWRRSVILPEMMHVDLGGNGVWSSA